MNRVAPPDISVREEIRNNLDVNFLVEAGAGSGKTTSMVNRMVSLITTQKTTIEKIAAITFTRKAAQELKERFQNKLEECYRNVQENEQKTAQLETQESTQEDTPKHTQKDVQKASHRERLKAALDNIEQSFIGTIHSFCATLLRERPVEGGIDPDFAELDELTDAKLHKQAWQQYLMAVRQQAPEKLVSLNEIGLKPSDLESIYYRITEYPDVEIVFTEVEKPTLSTALDKLKPYLDEALQWIPKTEPEKGYDSLQQNVLSALRILRYYDMSRESNILQILERFEKEQKVTLNRWVSDKDTTKRVNEEINFLSQTEIMPLLQRWREYCHFVAIGFLLPAVSFYEQLKRKQSSLNFQDLLLKAVAMLKNYPEIRSYFQNKYRYLLIDEFQDTDPIQAELMFFLTGQDIHEKQWYKLNPIPGSLFVVGDPKQSIYRFRRADIDIYNRFKQILWQTGGKVVALTANFRSVNILGDWFNETFKSLLPQQADAFQASFSTMQTLKEDTNGIESGIKIVSIPEVYKKKDEIVREDAQNIARIVRSAVDNRSFQLTRTAQELENGYTGKPEYKDFLLLLRYRDSMEVYARTLEEYGIPVQMSGGSSLSQVEEISEFMIVLQYLRDPDNQVFLLAVLRGIFFGISDAALAAYKAAGGNFYHLSNIPEALPDETKALFQGAYQKLSTYIGWTTQFTPVTVIEETAKDIGLIPLTLSGALPQAGCGYIYKIIESLKKTSFDQGSSFPFVVDNLQSLLEQDLDEELDISGEEQNAVRVMNLHKAKGLEASVVFLAHPFKRPAISPDHHIQRDKMRSRGFFLIKKETGAFSSKVIGQPVDWAQYENIEQNYQNAEDVRLLYVAATRAKNRLFISGSAKSNEKNPWEPLLNLVHDNDADFPVPDAEIPQQQETVVVIKPEELETFRQDVGVFVERCKKPGYSEVSPSEIMKKDPLYTVKGGYGAQWGTAIHRIIEKVVKDEEDLGDLLPIILEEQGFTDPQYVREAGELILQLKQSELYAKINRASQKLAEVPFYITLDENDPIYKEFCLGKPVPLTLEGIIDLAIKEEDGWSIIDYKTNYFETDEDLKFLVAHYTTQIRLYCEIWEKITGERVNSGELYFTGRGLVKVFPSYR